MSLKIGKRYIEEQLELENAFEEKALPCMFMDDKRNLSLYAILALILHVLVFSVLYILVVILGIKFPMLSHPEWQTKDIEFILTQNEAEPINKKTPYRSDRNSRAGGIHDPNRKVSMPSPAPSPTPKQSQSAPAAQPKVAQKPVQTPKPASQPKQVTRKQVETPKGISKPSKPAAPTQRPVLKPSSATPKPQMPKLTATPTSPFKVAVPNTGAPVGKGFSTSSGTSNTGGGSHGSPSGTGSKGTGMPAPQFSTTKTASAGSGTGTKGGTGKGGYGTGNMGNPGPGNPNGAPGIDAVKSPQWGPYMRALEAKIKQNWHPPKGDQSKRVVLLFKIGKRGELLSVKVSKSSGSQANDQAAISAVQMSAPFRALPPEFTGSSVEIDFTFDYNVLGATHR